MTPMGFFNGDEHSESRKWSEKKIDATIVRCHIATVAFTIPFFSLYRSLVHLHLFSPFAVRQNSKHHTNELDNIKRKSTQTKNDKKKIEMKKRKN